jgi:hypothetical protein
MIEEKKDYLFIVRTKENTDGLPEGSGVYVKKETKKYYIGDWVCMCGTCSVKVLKDKCKKLDDLK